MIKQTLILLFGILLVAASAMAQNEIVNFSTLVEGKFKYTTKVNTNGEKIQFQSDCLRTVKVKNGKIKIIDIPASTVCASFSSVPSATNGYLGAVEYISILEEESFLPISQYSNGPSPYTVDYKGEKIMGRNWGVLEDKTPVYVEKKNKIIYATGNGLDIILAALPLEIGYTTSMNLFAKRPMKLIEMQVEVISKEMVTVVGGDFEAYRLEITFPEVDSQTFVWIPVNAPRIVIKTVTNTPNEPTITTEYTGKKGSKKQRG